MSRRSSPLQLLAPLLLALAAFLPTPSLASEQAVASADRVVLQSWSESCGAAALATVLTFQFGDPVSEAEIVRALHDVGDPSRVTLVGGFSLLELKRFTLARGYQASGYGNLTLDDLDGFGASIVRLQDGDWDHFVVYRGATSSQVLVADPAAGTRLIPVEVFDRLWSDKTALVISRPGTSPARDELSASPLEVEAFSAASLSAPTGTQSHN